MNNIAQKFYELYYIVDPILEENSAAEVLNKLESFLVSRNSEVFFHKSFGLKNLAYPINKKKNGFCSFIQFSSTADVIRFLEIELKRDERIIRFLTTQLDKHALEYNEEKRAKNKKPSDSVV